MLLFKGYTMEVSILTNDKKTLEFGVKGVDNSVMQLIAERLNDRSEVTFAAYKLDHPVLGTPTVIVQTKKGSPLDVVLEVLESIQGDVSKLKKQFESA